ncbi:MAG: OadG family protein [Clostridiales bacterium]|nr:OadG family protein [Clostridiales bacterium]
MATQISWWMVVLLGMGIVFIGLGLLVLLCDILRVLLARSGHKAPDAAQPASQPAPAAALPTGPQRQKLMAIITAAIAEDLGQEVSGFRIVSFERRTQA